MVAHASSPDASLGERLFREIRFARPPAAMSCATCHLSDGAHGRAFADAAARSAVPAQSEDGRELTPRHASTLIESAEQGGWGLLHWDGEFTSMEDLVRATFAGRNFGWLPDEHSAALARFAAVIRCDGGDAASGRVSYAALFRDCAGGLDVAAASDAQIFDASARFVAEFVRTLRLSRDGEGRHNGSPYDAFLAANRLPRAPNPGETPHEYARRLHNAVAALRKPTFIDDPTRRLARHDQPFRFGEEELRGMRIFFRGAMGYVRSASAGNCAECHVPPHFTDFGFHNTGATQDRYDAVHGEGAFAKAAVPALAERNAAPERHLPPSVAHPRAAGPWREAPMRDDPARVDLGLWNIYANPALQAPQTAIERQLNRTGVLSREAVLALTLARFKTPSVRNLGGEGPLLHDGSTRSLESVVRLYRQMSDLARDGAMRNAPPEFAAMSLADDDVAPLLAFLRSLNEGAAR
ncbi:MAG: hypothetical protein HYV96_18275 [Opitutae bacterium]|nr:hypothetical protein [Opitutae bacterium]